MSRRLSWQSATTLGGSNIAAQCCDTADTSDANNCRRYATSNDDAGCIGGWPARATTFAQAAALCAAQGLSLCDISCNGKGCGYNSLPVSRARHAGATTRLFTPPSWLQVWTSGTCGSPVGPPVAAPTSAPTSWTPRQAMDGGKGWHPASTCITDQAGTTANGAVIAAQDRARDSNGDPAATALMAYSSP